MSALLLVVYAEYENGEPPFVWLGGRRRSAEKKRSAIRLMGILGRKGKHQRSRQGLAIRHDDWLLVQTTVGLSHDSGGPQGAVVIIKGIRSASDWAVAMTERITEVLRDGGIAVDHDEFRFVLESAARSTQARSLKRTVRTVKALTQAKDGRLRKCTFRRN